MKYWYDMEFIEDGRTIDLISIGVVAEDGRELYMQSAEYEAWRASRWVVENVFPHLQQCPEYPDLTKINHQNGILSADDASPLCRHEDCPWHSRAGMKRKLLAFCDPEKYGKPELWGYYSAYDHVALCQLFGKMIDLPDGWPKLTKDIKQWCDDLGNPRLPKGDATSHHHALGDARWTRDAYLFLDRYSRTPSTVVTEIDPVGNSITFE